MTGSLITAQSVEIGAMQSARFEEMQGHWMLPAPTPGPNSAQKQTARQGDTAASLILKPGGSCPVVFAVFWVLPFESLSRRMRSRLTTIGYGVLCSAFARASLR